MSQLTENIQADPFGWSFDSVVIPPSMGNDPFILNKLRMRLMCIANAARSNATPRRTGQAGSSTDHTSGAMSPQDEVARHRRVRNIVHL